MDVQAYASRVARLDLGGIDFGAFRRHPLPGDALRCLRYMHDVEFHTVCYLRDLLVTPAHRDPTVTTFLTMWNYEEFWHGEAIGRVLEAHGEPAGEARVAPLRARRRFQEWRSPIMQSLAAGAVGRAYVAVHMTWGAINEWTTQTAYARLIARARHTELTELLRRIMRQEGMHIDFYSSQAAHRLAASAKARWLTRAALRRFWSPVGAGVMPDTELRFISEYLFGDPDGRDAALRIDRRVDRLPGLAGMGLVQRAGERLVGGLYRAA
jgi:hypothetical protein